MPIELGSIFQLVGFLVIMAIHWGVTKTKIKSLEDAVGKLQEQKAGELGVRVADHDKRLVSVEAEQTQLRTTIYGMSAKVETSAAKVEMIYDLLKEGK